MLHTGLQSYGRIDAVRHAALLDASGRVSEGVRGCLTSATSSLSALSEWWSFKRRLQPRMSKQNTKARLPFT
jgi:hypothetical protein